MVIIRPDQYVSYVGRMDDIESVNSFFNGFMLPQTDGAAVKAAQNGEINRLAPRAGEGDKAMKTGHNGDLEGVGPGGHTGDLLPA